VVHRPLDAAGRSIAVLLDQQVGAVSQKLSVPVEVDHQHRFVSRRGAEHPDRGHRRPHRIAQADTDGILDPRQRRRRRVDGR
jgi:hypothetical protein